MFVRSETQRLAQYLVTLRALPRDGAPVQVLVVAPPGERARLRAGARLRRAPDLPHRRLRDAAARAAGLAVACPRARAAEAYYVHLAAKKSPREQFASREDRRRYSGLAAAARHRRRGCSRVLACALTAGARWLEALDVRGQAENQTREARARRRAISAHHRDLPGDPDQHRKSASATVVEFTRIAERTASPEGAFVHVSRVLDQFPQFELDRIDFSVGHPDRRDRAAPLTQSNTPGSRADPQAESAVRLEISGRVNATERNDYRAITAQVRSFAGALGRSGYELARTRPALRRGL